MFKKFINKNSTRYALFQSISEKCMYFYTKHNDVNYEYKAMQMEATIIFLL